MASSTTRPMASTIPSSVSTFSVNPSALIAAHAARIEIGIVMAGMRVARQLPRNAYITNRTSANEITSAIDDFVQRSLDETRRGRC